MSMSKAKPAVAVCKAKIAWTVLVVLVRVIVDINGSWCRKVQFVSVKLCMKSLTSQGTQVFIANIIQMRSYIKVKQRQSL